MLTLSSIDTPRASSQCMRTNGKDFSRCTATQVRYSIGIVTPITAVRCRLILSESTFLEETRWTRALRTERRGASELRARFAISASYGERARLQCSFCPLNS
eukprot:6210651-Pleurochrysis_carterae.AAC.2